LKDEAKKKAKEIKTSWENTTKDIQDISESIKMLQKQVDPYAIHHNVSVETDS
jgi:prefoldin subunit 5